MLTGQKPFVGDDVSDTLALVLKFEPEWDSLPTDVPARVRQLIQACLQKNPKQRVHDVADVRLAMEGAFETTVGASSEPPAVPQLHVWQRPTPLVLAGLASMLLGGLIVWSAIRPAPGLVARFDYDLPDGQSFFNPGRPLTAISPDGRAFAYNTTDGLYLRAIGELEARLIPGTRDDLSTPFFSPDGQSLGYWDRASSELKRVNISGGAPVTIAGEREQSVWGDLGRGRQDPLWTDGWHLAGARDRRYIGTPDTG